MIDCSIPTSENMATPTITVLHDRPNPDEGDASIEGAVNPLLAHLMPTID
jgi:hypothetical protein